MRIERIVIKKLRALRERDDRFPTGSVCLRGVNGSGKTTYIDAVGSLWQLFRRWSQKGTNVRHPEGSPLPEAELMAMKLVGLPGPAPELWLVHGQQESWEAVAEGDQVEVAGVLRSGTVGAPKNLRRRDDPLHRFWDDAATKLEQPGSAEIIELPNMVVIGAEDRYIHPLRTDLFELAPEASFRWLARYEPSRTKQGHIENSLAALLAVNPERYLSIADEIHHILPHFRLLNRTDPQSRRPLVRLEAPAIDILLERLSGGERAALIALFTVVRWMTKGGIVLIDEPELHQHLSLMRSTLAVLEEYVVRRMGGQLIVASHAPEVWDHFRGSGNSIIELERPEAE